MVPALYHAMVEIVQWEFRETTENVYSDCTVSYKDPVTGKATSGATTDPGVNATAPHLIYHYDRHDGVPRGPGEEVTLF